jgi:hypothetical protein
MEARGCGLMALGGWPPAECQVVALAQCASTDAQCEPERGADRHVAAGTAWERRAGSALGED